jgi:Flp pilus assembly protein TadG
MKMPTRLQRFSGARGGLAAIEFAILAPMMVFVLFASIELLDLLDTNRRIENSAASVADVTSRDTEISNAELAGLWTAFDALMFPDTGAGIRMRLTSITVETPTVARVVWSEGRSMTPRAENGTIDLPDGMMVTGANIIYAETESSYAGPLGFLLATPMTLSNNVFRRSRLVDPIPRVP